MKRPDIYKLIFCVSAYAISMGFMEAAVVIYLREIFYPGGFNFPLTPIPHALAVVEICREAATVIMLICTGYLAGRSKTERLAFFSLAFAIWDLFYYVFLWVTLGWPDSIFTWDILFLIPVPWVGPVWAPCLLSLLMIYGSVYVIRSSYQQINFSILKTEWVLLTGGAAICILSFMLDFFRVTRSAFHNPVFSATDLFSDVHSYVPQKFDTEIFLTGFGLMAFAVFNNQLSTNKKNIYEKK